MPWEFTVARLKCLLKLVRLYTSARRLSNHVGDTCLESCTHIVIVDTMAMRPIGWAYPFDYDL